MNRTRAAALFGLVFLAAGLGGRAFGQDVSISPLSFVYPDDAPDQLPSPKHEEKPKFPDDLRKTGYVGYVCQEVFVDSKGKVLSLVVHSTAPTYERRWIQKEGTDAYGGSWAFTPALRAGKPVNSLVHFSFAFNPTSAHVEGPEASVRLLDARTVPDPKWTLKEGEAGDVQKVAWAVVSVDTMGRPVEVKDVPDPFAELLLKNLKDWRFAPARHSGAAVTQDVRIPFIIVPGDTGPGKSAQPPKVVHQDPPEYPRAMRLSGMRGEVLVDFVVDIEGRVIRPFVVRSLNPAFDAPSIDCVRSWVFEPGQANGVPVYTHMQVPIFFALDGRRDGGESSVTEGRGGDQSKLPEELRVDTQPKVRSIVVAVYPYELLRDDIRGSSNVGYVVDVNGLVAATKVMNSSRPEFGFALQAAVERFEYDAALKNGHPNKALMGFEQDFSRYNSILVSDEDDRLLSLERKHPERIARANDLDSPVKALVRRSPVFPKSLTGKIAGGEALVELLVDEHGHARLPRIVSASEPAFGYAAVQAVALWQFSPPVSKGSPVVTRVRIPFNFGKTEPVGARSP
jgi:TonB family protein